MGLQLVHRYGTVTRYALRNIHLSAIVFESGCSLGCHGEWTAELHRADGGGRACRAPCCRRRAGDIRRHARVGAAGGAGRRAAQLPHEPRDAPGACGRQGAGHLPQQVYRGRARPRRRQGRHPVRGPRRRPGLVRLPERRPGRRTPGPGVRGRSPGHPGLEAPRARARPGDRAGRGHVRAGGPGGGRAARPPRRGGLRRLRSGPGQLARRHHVPDRGRDRRDAGRARRPRAGQRGHRRLHAARGAARRRGRHLRQPRRPGVRRAWRAVAVVLRAG